MGKYKPTEKLPKQNTVFLFFAFFWGGEGGEGENPLPRKKIYHITEAFSSLENSSPECQLFRNKWLHKAGLPSVGRGLSSAFTHHYENVTTVTSFLKKHKIGCIKHTGSLVNMSFSWEAFPNLPLDSLSRKMSVYARSMSFLELTGKLLASSTMIKK